METKSRRTVEDIKGAYLEQLYEEANHEAFVWVERKRIQEKLDLSDKELETAIVRLKDKQWAKFTLGSSYLTADGLHELESRMSRTTSEALPTAGAVFNIGGDLVTGNQSKTGDISVQGNRKGFWSLEALIAAVGVLVAIGAIIAAFTVPEMRSWMCSKAGILCGSAEINRP